METYDFFIVKGAGRSPAAPPPIFFDGAKHYQKKLQTIRVYTLLAK
jgi:hypothetical protein